MRSLAISFCFLLFLAPAAPVARAQVVFLPPSDYTRQFVAGDSLELLSVNHGPFRLYFEEGSWTSQNLPVLEAKLDTALVRILDVLNAPACPRGVYLLAVDSEEAMQRLMGWHIKGGAAPGHDLVFFVFSPTVRPQFKHEIFHLLADEVWGPASHRLLNEGGAVYTDNECFYDNPIDGIPAWMRKHRRLFPLEKLLADFDGCAAKNEVAAYLESASIFKYLYETYGPDRMRRLWKEGFGALGAIYGLTPATLEESWLKRLSTVTPPADLNWDRLMKEGCG